MQRNHLATPLAATFAATFAAAFAALALSACDKQPTIVTTPPTVITTPGPAGPAGPQGEAGKPGEGTTINVMPAASAASGS